MSCWGKGEGNVGGDVVWRNSKDVAGLCITGRNHAVLGG